MEDDLEYFTRRHLQHAKAAAESDEPAARHVHKRLSDLHRKNAGKALADRMENATLKPRMSETN
jgi:hypothetical protein